MFNTYLVKRGVPDTCVTTSIIKLLVDHMFPDKDLRIYRVAYMFPFDITRSSTVLGPS